MMPKYRREASAYLNAIVLVGAALGVRVALDPLLGDHAPYLTFFAAVVLAAWYGGLRPGLGATILSLLAAWYFVVPTRFSFGGLPTPEMVGLMIFLAAGTLIAVAVGRLRTSHLETQESEQIALQMREEATGIGDELRRRVEELDALLGVIPVGIFVAHDPACVRITMNPTGAQMLGIDEKANASKSAPGGEKLPFRVLKDGVEVPAADLPMQRAARTGEIIREEVLELVRQGEKSRWLYEYAVPLYSHAGELRGSVGAFVDITERKQAEWALRDSEQLFKSLARHAPVGIFQTDAEGNCSLVNEKWCRLAGLAPDATRGEGWVASIHPDDRERVRAEWRASTLGESEFASEYRFQTPEGEVTWVSGSATALTNEQGKISGYIGTVTDITEQKRAEETVRALLRISERLNSTLDVEELLDILVQEAITLVGAESGVSGLRSDAGMTSKRYFQKGKMLPLEYCWPPMHGLPGWLIMHKMPYLTNDALKDGQIVHELCHQLGVRSALSTPIVTAEGEVVGFFEIHNKKHDEGFTAADREMLLAVSQTAAVAVQNALAYRAQRQAQLSLQEADRRKDEFLATLAHELRNPLAPLRNGLSLLRLDDGDEALVDETLTMMERQLQQMVRLIDDLLDVSRISRGKLELRRNPVELAAVITSAVETCRPMIAAAGHQLEITLPEEEIYLDADATRLAQSFANLLNNACKFTEPGGRIGLSANTDQGEVVVVIRDSGMGIPPQMLDRIFEMFTQVDASLERSHGGLGIGLTLVKRLVELHGGTVSARSEGEGKGSEFAVRIPMKPCKGSEPMTHDSAQPDQRPAPRRILVADDNRDSAKSLAMMLRALGNEVSIAHDGQEAVDLVASHRPEVAVLDIGMPKLNGYDAARQIRQQSWGEEVVLIALTGWGQEEDKRRSKEAGFDHHLVKPVELATLKQVLEPAPVA